MKIPHNKLPPVERLVSLIKERKAHTFEQVCDMLDMSPAKVHKLLAEAKAKNYAVDLTAGHVGIRPSQASEDVVNIKVSKAGKTRKIASISDPHFGSKYHLRAQLEDFVYSAYEEGVRTILLPGDNLDGCYRHGRWELTHHGFQEQVAEFRLGLPMLSGLRYYGITGNHDQTFENETGIVVHEAINDHFRANGRRDLVMLGARGAYLRLIGPGERRGLFVELWHPLKGPAYALTYKLQKKVEGYAPGQKPDMLFTGHWHQATYCQIRAVHAFSCGTFQGGGSSFGKSLGGAPTIGSWIVGYSLTQEGTIRDVEPKFKSYYESETPREVRLG